MREAMELAKVELKRFDNNNVSKTNKRRVSASNNRLKKSVTKTEGPGDQYKKVKSRLFKSIESSRNKEQKKFVNQET